ncbi:hypothetical protein AGRA3207_003301 [Actinomadura graeca]|uniref:Cobalamin biosynthesis protein CbiX n=1 Tax=Actinomadura graeca TaxID=2750812 RepID=A0ABX8QXY5_9ACTN|nr:hypothetical protein [Actinomadura graeca]QXJ22317.1 hypothetical protein AGRA3207_003301 [Actinomadura graeca]
MTSPPRGPGPPDRAVLTAGGHECPAGDGGTPRPGRALAAALQDRPRAVVVPMTLGRDPGLTAAAAQTMAWAARDREPGALLLARPLGTVTHLVGWLRAAVVRALRGGDGGRAALLVAPAGRPEDDAELFKVARLVWRHLRAPWVEVAFGDGEPGVPDGADRCRRLGAREVVLVPASLVPPPVWPGALTAGPLLGPAALAALVRARAAEAELRWGRDGDDGLAAAGHRHGHGHEHGHGHRHGHEHGHGHGHGHPHEPAHDHFAGITETSLREAAVHGR